MSSPERLTQSVERPKAWSALTSLTAFPVTLEVGISSRFVHIVQTGWGKARQWHLPCKPAAPQMAEPAWQPAVSALAHWLAAQNDGRVRQLRIRLSGRFAHWQLLPWQVDVAGREERTALAGLRFREQLGGTAAQWSVTLADTPPGQPTPAVAMDATLLSALQALSGPQVRVVAVQPYFACAFDRWRGRGANTNGWFGVLESDAITFGLLERGRWQCVYAQALDGEWQPRFLSLLHLASLASDAAILRTAAPLPLRVAGDLVQAPTPTASLRERYAWDWLGSPPRRGLEAMQGLRLALGT